MKVLREVSRRSNCVEIVRKGCTVVSRRKERARRFYEVGCPKVKLEQDGEGSCGKVCEEGLPKAKLEQEGEGSAMYRHLVCKIILLRILCGTQ